MADPKQNQKHEVIKTLKEPKKTLFTVLFFFLVNSFCRQHAHELSQNNNTVLL